MTGISNYPQLSMTRLAPTPSGYLHLGNVMSFVITATLAKKCNAKILLRIDDMDRERVRDEYLQDIFDTLSFLEIPYHEGPANVKDFKSNWSQLSRMDLYSNALLQLKHQGDVFACQCSRTQLQQYHERGYVGKCILLHLNLDQEQLSWRLKTDDAEQVTIKFLTGETQDVVLTPDMRNFVVRKKDGHPAYQLSSLCDDAYFKVDLIVRGQDLWPSTVAQQYLAHKLGAATFTNATFYHHPLIKATDGNKLSKSMGATSIKYMRDQGYSKATVFMNIAQHFGIKDEVINWQQLGEMLLLSLSI